MATDFNLVNDASKFEINGSFGVTTNDALPAIRFAVGNFFEDTVAYNYPIEFVANCTGVNIRGNWYRDAFVSVDGGAFTTVTAPGTSGVNPLLTGLSAGNHLIRVYTADGFWNGFQLVGGTETIDTVATTKVVAHGTAPANRTIAAGTTPAKVWGAQKLFAIDEGDLNLTSGTGYGGQIAEFSFTGTDVDVATIGGVNPTVSIDGGIEIIASGGDSGNHTQNSYVRFNETSAASGSHTFRATWAGGSANIKGFRVLNGSRLSSASIVGATTITVDDGTKFASTQWIRIGLYGQCEYRQISGVSGNVLNVTALANAHAQYTAVTGWHHPAGTITAGGVDRSGMRIGALGDSNTAATSTYGMPGGEPGPGPGGALYFFYDSRSSYATQLGNTLTAEVVNLGITGTTTVDWNNAIADIAGMGQDGYDAFFIWPATNDVNGNITTPTEFETNVRALVVAARAALKTGGKVYLFGSKTPSTTSAKGLDSGVIQTRLATIAADATYGGDVLEVTDLAYVGINLTTYDAGTNPTGELSGVLHYMPSGETKIAANFAAMLTPGTSGLLLKRRRAALAMA